MHSLHLHPFPASRQNYLRSQARPYAHEYAYKYAKNASLGRGEYTQVSASHQTYTRKATAYALYALYARQTLSILSEYPVCFYRELKY